MRYLSLLKDSWIEALDRKSLYFLLVVCVLVIGLCAGVGYKELTAQEAIKHQHADFTQVVSFTSGNVRIRTYPVRFDLDAFQALPDGGYEYDVTVTPADEFFRLVEANAAARSGRAKKAAPVEDSKVPPEPEPAVQAKFLRSRYLEAGFPGPEVEAKAPGQGARTFHVRLKALDRKLVEGAYEVSVFGAWSTRLKTSVASFVASVQFLLAEYLAGIFGVMIAVIFTANSIPSMLQKGTLDLLLSKPIHRPGMLLTKYVGGLIYVVIPSILLIGGSWLVLSFRAGYWNPGFLVCIPALLALFAILYSFSALVGVLFRSPIAAIFLTLGLWFVAWAVDKSRQMIHLFGWEVPGALGSALEGLRWILPRTADIGYLTRRYLDTAASGGEAAALRQQLEEQLVAVPAASDVFLSSAIFVVVMLGAAIWVFRRRDY